MLGLLPAALASLHQHGRSGCEQFARTPLEKNQMHTRPPLPWNGSKYMCTHSRDITEDTTTHGTGHHKL